MAGVTENLYLNELKRQRWILGGLMLLLAGSAAMSRNQRELFGAVGSEPPTATAFAAIVPPELNGRVIGNPTALFAAARLRLPRAAARRVLPVTEAEAIMPDLGVAVGPAETNFAAEPALVEPLGIAGAPELAFLSEPLDFAPPPVIGVLAELVPPHDSVSNHTSVVPEPSIWMMLVFGFLGIGAFMRRAKLQAADLA